MAESKGLVIVTGAAGGIGAAVAAAFAAASRPLALWDADPAVHAVFSRIRRSTSGFVGQSMEVDVCDPAAVADAYATVVANSGAPAVVVHAAGVVQIGSALELTPAAWERCLSVNATGTMHVVQGAAREMVAAGGGSIVVVSSNAASTPRVGMAAYCAAKAAATAFTRALGLEVARHGVRVNLVSPGSTDTPMLRGMWHNGNEPLDADAVRGIIAGNTEDYRLGIPLQRVGQPEDIAAAVCFLASDAARHITLHDLRLDGGATLDM